MINDVLKCIYSGDKVFSCCRVVWCEVVMEGFCKVGCCLNLVELI